MSFLKFLLVVALLVLVVTLILAVRKYKLRRSSLLPTTNYRYSGATQSRFYSPPVETRSQIPQSILSLSSRSGSLAAQNDFSTIYSQQSPRQLPPSILSPLPAAARKSQQYSVPQDDHLLASIEQTHRPVTTKGPGQKTIERPLEPVYRPSPELSFKAQKPPPYAFSWDGPPGPSVERSHQPAVRKPVQETVQVCIKPQPFRSLVSQDEAAAIVKGKDEDEDQDLDHLVLRELATQEFENMKECRREEKLARRFRQHVRARECGIEAQRHRKRMQELNDQASEVIFAKKNKVLLFRLAITLFVYLHGIKDPTLRKIDLHGLTVKEAINHTNRALKQARALGNTELCIVVGKGIHSEGGQPKLKPAVQAFLKEHQFPAELDPNNHGALVVRLDSAPGS